MKYAVLQGVNLLFSGIMALDTKPEDSEFWKMARTFGATCLTEPSPRLTHVIATQVSLVTITSLRRGGDLTKELLFTKNRWVRRK